MDMRVVNSGWVCPKCGCVYAPWYHMCLQCGRANDMPSVPFTDDFPSTVVQGVPCTCGTTIPCKLHGGTFCR